MINFENIVSKIAAGGLSAGVFLFWWPEHVPGDGIEQLIMRGLLWTLSFELLLFAFAPFERIATARIERRTEARRAAVRQRLAAAPAPAKTGGAVALACLGLAAPVTLLAGAPHELVKDAVPAREVVKQVVVEKPVVTREVIVKRVVVRAQDAQLGARGATAASSASIRTAPTTTPATAKPTKRAATATTQAKKPAAAAETKKTTTAKAKAEAEEPVTALAAPATPAPAATTPAPAATATTTDAPASASAPAATAAQP